MRSPLGPLHSGSSSLGYQAVLSLALAGNLSLSLLQGWIIPEHYCSDDFLAFIAQGLLPVAAYSVPLQGTQVGKAAPSDPPLSLVARREITEIFPCGGKG